MKRCKTCKHWGQSWQGPFGKCERVPMDMDEVMLRDRGGARTDQLIPGITVTAVCAGFDSANLMTTAEHGCTMHEDA